MEKYIVYWIITSILYSAEIKIEEPYYLKTTAIKPYTIVDKYQKEFYVLSEAIEFYTDLKTAKKTTPAYRIINKLNK